LTTTILAVLTASTVASVVVAVVSSRAGSAARGLDRQIRLLTAVPPPAPPDARAVLLPEATGRIGDRCPKCRMPLAGARTEYRPGGPDEPECLACTCPCGYTVRCTPADADPPGRLLLSVPLAVQPDDADEGHLIALTLAADTPYFATTPDGERACFFCRYAKAVGHSTSCVWARARRYAGVELA
jgi:hypothetical protein